MLGSKLVRFVGVLWNGIETDRKKMNINNKWELLSIITLFGFFIRNII